MLPARWGPGVFTELTLQGVAGGEPGRSSRAQAWSLVCWTKILALERGERT